MLDSHLPFVVHRQNNRQSPIVFVGCQLISYFPDEPLSKRRKIQIRQTNESNSALAYGTQHQIQAMYSSIQE
jgi:hypothetical protein